MKKIIYPLEQVLEVKERRVSDAEKVVKEKREILNQEEKKLATYKEERDKVKSHYQEKLSQLRTLLDEGSTSPKIQQTKVYLKTVSEKLIIEEKKVKDQQDKVKAAEKNLQQALDHLKLKRQEVDKLALHKKDWEKTTRRELEIKEGIEQDELGSVVHQSNLKRNIN